MTAERVRNMDIPEYWKKGRPAKNHGATGWDSTFHTDGTRLYSYGLLIGDTCKETGLKVLRDFTARGKWGYQSQTTSCHVGNARVFADIID